MKKSKIYPEKEIEKLPDKYRLTNKAKLFVCLTVGISLTGLIMLALGITFLVLNGQTEMVVLITFGGMIFVSGFLCLLFVQIDKKKDQEIKQDLINQAITSSFDGKVIYDPLSKVSTNLLRELDICPFDVLNSGEKILVTAKDRNISIVEVTSSSNLTELMGFIMAAPELGVLGTAFLGLYTGAKKIKDKSIINSKFKGTIMLFTNFRESANDIIEIRSKKFLTPFSSIFKNVNLTPFSSIFKNVNKFETEDIRANEKYNFYASDKNAGFRFVKPLMIETVNKIDAKLKNGFVLVFKDDYLVLAFSEETIDIKNIAKNKNITAKTAYFMTKERVRNYESIIKDVLTNRYF